MFTLLKLMRGVKSITAFFALFVVLLMKYEHNYEIENQDNAVLLQSSITGNGFDIESNIRDLELINEAINDTHFYTKLSNVLVKHNFIEDEDLIKSFRFASMHGYNLENDNGYSDKQACFTLYNDALALVIIHNAMSQELNINLQIPVDLVVEWQLLSGPHLLQELLSNQFIQITVNPHRTNATVELQQLKKGLTIYVLHLNE